MSNVSLIKDDAMPLIIPACSVTAVVSLAPPYVAPSQEHPEARCVIYSNFGGFKVHFLAQTAGEVFAEVSGKTDTAAFFDVPAGDDRHYLRRDAFKAIEGIKGEEGEPAEMVVVHFLDSSGQGRIVRGDFAEGTVQAIMSAVSPPEAPASKRK